MWWFYAKRNQKDVFFKVFPHFWRLQALLVSMFFQYIQVTKWGDAWKYEITKQVVTIPKTVVEGYIWREPELSDQQE